MPRRRPSSCAQQMAPEGLPGGGDRRRRDPLLPRLLLPELRAASGAGASGGSRASEGGAEWWEAPTCESSASDPGVGVRRPRSRLPVLPTVAQRAARNRPRAEVAAAAAHALGRRAPGTGAAGLDSARIPAGARPGRTPTLWATS